MKKKYFIPLSIVIAMIAALAVTILILLQKPSVRFLFHMAELTTPCDYYTEERSFDLGDRTLGVMIYRHKKIKSDKYYMVVHGLTPQERDHPAMHKIAASICDATGMNVLKPYIDMRIQEGRLPVAMSVENFALAYKTLHEKIPGEYRAMGGCLGATTLLIALERVPREIYPKKVLLLGPVFDGKKMIDYYNKAGVNVDFIVKLATSLTSDIYSDDEKKLIQTAFNAVKPGVTDKNEMRKILGDGLYHDLLMLKVRNSEFEKINLESILLNKKAFPDCEYYILHSANDTIVPRVQGEALYKFMKKYGYHSNFVGTEIFDHSENKVTVSGFIKEMKYLVGFFDGLFSGDDELSRD